ncbi:hypothetical protein DFH29DRAFT_984909 [Suillus ampliporus]|nr:hypothetical protein DFH29DRAFT_984909 [Suillus ampliporus]
MKDWTSPIYAFFKPTPGIKYHDGRHCHMCKYAKSTGNMCKHAAMECRNTAAVQDGVALMKTGRPKYHIPSPLTVACDVKQVFVKTCKWIVQMLQNYDGELNFAMDTWTSPNHRAYMAVSVHLEHKDQLFSMILDIVKLPKVVVLTRMKPCTH